MTHIPRTHMEDLLRDQIIWDRFKTLTYFAILLGLVWSIFTI